MKRIKPLSIYPGCELRSWLEQEAAKKDRSLNQQILRHLKLIKRKLETKNQRQGAQTT